MAGAIENFWYRRSIFRWLLWPIHGVFFLLISLRRWLYRQGVLKGFKASVPVLIVGNISVGGTGKTPFIIWLVQYLQQNDINTAVISRGYGGTSNRYPLQVDNQTSAKECGDEPKLIFDATGIPVVVDPSRAQAAKYAVDKNQPQLLISDDGMQHYALSRDAEICIIDGFRDLGNQFLMPVGPLREPRSRLRSCDMVIQNSGEPNYDHYFSIEAIEWVNLCTGNTRPVADLAGDSLVAICGIGNPEKFANTLRQNALRFKLHCFADHYQYTVADFNEFGEDILVMTEKDAVKCRSFAKSNWWYLRVDIRLNKNTQLAIDKLIANLTGGSHG